MSELDELETKYQVYRWLRSHMDEAVETVGLMSDQRWRYFTFPNGLQMVIANWNVYVGWNVFEHLLENSFDFYRENWMGRRLRKLIYRVHPRPPRILDSRWSTILGDPS